jgi:hypothetical protein
MGDAGRPGPLGDRGSTDHLTHADVRCSEQLRGCSAITAASRGYLSGDDAEAISGSEQRVGLGLGPGAGYRAIRGVCCLRVNNLMVCRQDVRRRLDARYDTRRRRPVAKLWNIRPSRGSIGEGDAPSRSSVSPAIF